LTVHEATASDPKHRIVVLGKITGAFGIGGWVKVESYTVPLDNVLRYATWQLGSDKTNGDREWRASKALQGRVTNKGLQVQLAGVHDRTQAEQLAGTLIGVPRDVLPPPAPGEYYWDDLVGLDAYSPAGECLGKIADIRATTAHALLSIIDEQGGKRVEHLVPLVSERLVKVDLDARRATVDWDRSWS